MNATDYARVEKAILYLDRNGADQPRLEAVARHVGLSPFHFSRLFRRWAGLSPKRFLEVLTARHARAALAEEPSLLGAAFRTGLSGPGRLHDLTVSIYAMTPAELRDGGRGLVIRTGIHPSPFGECLVGLTTRGICWLSFVSSDGRRRAIRELQEEWPAATFKESPGDTRGVVRRAFEGGTFRLHVRGTNFQVRVWEALLRIPPGSVRAYGDVAREVGRPSASRAVGTAVGSNPVSVLVPCHRVIRATGGLGGYRWGENRKRALLAWEAARSYLR